MQGLVISVTALPAGDGMCSVLRLAGEADMGTTELRDALAAELAGRPRLLLLDMSGLRFIDSGATQMIIAAYQLARREGGTLAIAGISAPVARVLELTGVDQRIRVFGTADDAITTLTQGEPDSPVTG